MIKEIDIMKNNRDSRQEVLKQAGIDTNNFFSITFNEGLKPGATIHVSIDQPEYPEEVRNEREKLRNQIIEDGYVRNTKLHRRWVMAQMFRMLNYHSYRTGKDGYDAYLVDNYSYHYQFTMMLEEVRVLSKLETRNPESFTERSHFFNCDVIAATLNDYLMKLKDYIASVPEKIYKTQKYKKLFQQDVLLKDIYKTIIYPEYLAVNKVLDVIKSKERMSYSQIYKALKKCVNGMYRLPEYTPKCKEWKDAFKGAGSYYTLMNMVKFHGCFLYNYKDADNGYHKFNAMFGTEACYYLKDCLDEYKGEYYRMFALLKQVIKDNNFDFYTRMAEIYS